MSYNIQQDLASLVNEYNYKLQQAQSLRATGNIQLASTLENEAGMLHQRYQIAVQRYNAMVSQQQQPQYSYQQQQQQPQYVGGYQQPLAQVPGLFVPVQQGQIFNVPSESTGIGSKYDQREVVPLVKPLQPVVMEAPVEKKKLKPLPGHEFPFLLDVGYVSDVVEEGDYYKYVVAGSSMSRYAPLKRVTNDDDNELKLFDTYNLVTDNVVVPTSCFSFKLYKMVKHTYEALGLFDDEMYNTPTVEQDGVNIPSIADEITVELINNDIKMFISKTQYTNVRTDELVNFLSKYKDMYFSENLNKLITKRFNALASKTFLLGRLKIDDYLEDYDSLMTTYVNNTKPNRNLALVDSIKKIIDLVTDYGYQIMSTIEANSILDIKSKDNQVIGEMVYMTHYTVIPCVHISKTAFGSSPLANILPGEQYTVSSTYCSELHALLNQFKFKDINSDTDEPYLFNKSNYGKIVTLDEGQKPVLFSVYASRENFIIERD